MSQYIGPIQTFTYLKQKVIETKTKQLWKPENITILKINSSMHLHQFSLYLQHITKCDPNVHVSAGDRLETACEVVNHSDAFLFGDGSDVLSDCLFQFKDCLRVVLKYTVLQITP